MKNVLGFTEKEMGAVDGLLWYTHTDVLVSVPKEALTCRLQGSVDERCSPRAGLLSSNYQWK